MTDFENNHLDETEHESSDADSSLQRYLHEIGKFPLLDREEEIRIAHSIRQGDPEAFKTLIKSNLRFVVMIAKKYQNCGLSLLDLINEGNIGLIEAAKRFDPDKGVKFVSYAVWWIRQAIMQAFASQGGAVRIPIKQALNLYHIGETYRNLKQRFERDPTINELADEMGIDPLTIDLTLKASRTSLPLEQGKYESSEYNRVMLLPDIHQSNALDNSLRSRLLEDLNKMLDRLDTRERQILELHYGLNDGEPKTLEEIGTIFNLSRERIRQIENSAKKKLQKLAEQASLEDYLN